MEVSGTYATFEGLEEVDARSGTIAKTGVATRPEPITVILSDIEQNGSRTAELQSMRVRVLNVVAMTDTAGRDFLVGQYVTSASIEVTSYMANDVGPSPFPATTGETFASITGMVYSAGYDALAPMSADDVVIE